MDIPVHVIDLEKQKNGFSSEPVVILRATTETGAKVSVCHGNITAIDSDVIINFVPQQVSEYNMSPIMSVLVERGGTRLKQDLLRALEQSPASVDPIVQASPGELFCAELFHVVVPPWINNEKGITILIDNTLTKVFDKVVSFNKIIFTPLTVQPLGYPVEFYSDRLLAAILNAPNSMEIMIFIEDCTHYGIFDENMKKYGYRFDDVSAAVRDVAEAPRAQVNFGKMLNALLQNSRPSRKVSHKLCTTYSSQIANQPQNHNTLEHTISYYHPNIILTV